MHRKSKTAPRQSSINQIGMQGFLELNARDPKSKHQLQFGAYVSLAPAPYSNSIVLTIVPRYTVINYLNKPIEIYQSAGVKPPKKRGYFYTTKKAG